MELTARKIDTGKTGTRRFVVELLQDGVVVDSAGGNRAARAQCVLVGANGMIDGLRMDIDAANKEAARVATDKYENMRVLVKDGTDELVFPHGSSINDEREAVAAGGVHYALIPYCVRRAYNLTVVAIRETAKAGA